MKRKSIIAGLLLLFICCFSGCGSRTVKDMYTPPRRSDQFKNLQIAIEQAMQGMEYAAPVSGDNQQSVQNADLTGDGVEEYIVFARGNAEKPLQILVFSQVNGDDFELLDTISVNGAAFEQVDYVDMDGKPGCEMLVGSQLSDRMMRIASVISFHSGESVQLMSTLYAKFLACDFDENGINEFLVIRQGEGNTDNAVAFLYDFSGENVERSMEITLSSRADNIRRIRFSALEGTNPAVFISGSVDGKAIATDVLTNRRGELINVSGSFESGNSVAALRNYYVYPEDADADGIMELPGLIDMRSLFSTKGDKQYLIGWYSVDMNGNEYDKLFTYHNYRDGWYLQLDSEWASRVTVENDSNTFAFYIWGEDFQEAMAVFSIYALSDNNRDEQAAQGNRFILCKTENVTYAAKLDSGSAVCGITEEYLIESFNLIQQEKHKG